MTDAPLRVLAWGELGPRERDALLRRGADAAPAELVDGIVRLIADVRERGDAALVDALREFDGCEVAPDRLRVPAEEIERARDELPPELLGAIRDSIARVRRFNERSIAGRDWLAEIEPGVLAGQKLTPIPSAGLFVPSGKGSYPSSAFQIAVPAVVAGVPEIAVVTPPVPGSDGRVDPAVLAVAAELGIERVFRLNGPAGVAALAFGTETVPRTLKVLGPGSSAVQVAQLEVQRYGTATVTVLGPTESLVIADRAADPGLLAADLLTEAEHGADSAALLVTPDADLVEAVQAELAGRLARLPERRAGYARAALGKIGGAVIVADLEQAVEVANLYAPEHLQLATADPERLLDSVEHAAEILLGQETPFAAANYTIGVPAALPTSRFARVSSGVSAETFMKRASIARLSAEALERLGPPTLALAEWEGFAAHAAAVSGRQSNRATTHQEVA